MKASTIALLRQAGKPQLTSAELSLLLHRDPASLAVSLHRWVRAGWLIRLRRGLYALPGAPVDAQRAAQQLVRPCYLSFESVLARTGILSQQPYHLTFATTARPRYLAIGATQAIFRRLLPELFFGYRLQNGLWTAEPEKALLDSLHLCSLGKLSLPVDHLDLRGLDAARLRRYASRFPTRVQRAVASLPSGLRRAA